MMTIDEKLERLTGIVESLAAQLSRMTARSRHMTARLAFGLDPSAAGKTLYINRKPNVVVG